MNKKDPIDIAFDRKKKRQKVFRHPLPKKEYKKEDYSKYFYCEETQKFVYTPTKKICRRSDRSHINIFNDYRGDVRECQKCGSNVSLQIHHINKLHRDNHPLNLIKLCLSCHVNAHKGDAIYPLMKRRLDFILGNK